MFRFISILLIDKIPWNCGFERIIAKEFRETSDHFIKTTKLFIIDEKNYNKVYSNNNQN